MHLKFGKFVCGVLLIRDLVWKTLFIMFLSVGHYKFMNLSVRHRTMSTGQLFSSFFVYWTLCGVSQTN
jgi:hypothetical protein